MDSLLFFLWQNIRKVLSSLSIVRLSLTRHGTSKDGTHLCQETEIHQAAWHPKRHTAGAFGRRVSVLERLNGYFNHCVCAPPCPYNIVHPRTHMLHGRMAGKNRNIWPKTNNDQVRHNTPFSSSPVTV